MTYAAGAYSEGAYSSTPAAPTVEVGHAYGEFAYGELGYAGGDTQPGSPPVAAALTADAEGNAHTVADLTFRYLLDAEGNAHTAGTMKQLHAAVGNAEGNAHTSGAMAQQHRAGASAEGNAHTSNATLVRLLFAGGDAEGNAHTNNAFLARMLYIDALIEGDATTGSPALTTTLRVSGFVEGRAYTDGFAERYIQGVNPALGLTTAVYSLTVAGTPVDLAAPSFQLEDLAVDYNGKQLTFSEIGTIGLPAFSPEDAVSLDVDLGNGAFRWFTGAVRVRETVGQNNNEGFNYTAFGYQNLADEVTLVNTDGRPEIEWTVGTTVTSVRSDGTDVVTIFSKSIAEAMQELFDINASALNTAGIPATIGSPGLSQFTGNLPESLRFQNVGFNAAVTQLARLETGVKVFFNDDQQAWSFPNLLQAPTAIVEINSVNLVECVFDTSTQDRYTAVKLFADVDDLIDEAIASKTDQNVGGRSGSVSRTEVTLTPKWLPELQTDWTIEKAHQGVLGTLEDEFFWVYRRWSLPDSIAKKWPGTPVRLWQKFNYWGTEIWKRTHGRVNFRRREFISRFPLIHRGNPHVPGDVIGPVEVKMAYYPKTGSTFTYVSTTNSAGTPTYASTGFDSSEFPTEIRWPPTGFTGSAYDIFGVERELVRVVSKTEVTTANANATLRLHKDVVIDGDLPLDGDPMEVVVNLNRQVLVTHATLTTGIESFPALMTGYSYQFGKRGRNTVRLTTDVAGLIPGAV